MATDAPPTVPQPPTLAREALPTIRDVARAAGVSVSSVSKVLNDKPNVSAAVRARVRAVVQELGYRPSVAARSLHSKRTQTLAFLVPSIENPFFSAVLRSVEDSAHADGYGVLVGNTHGDAARVTAYRERLLALGIDGVLFAQSWDIVSGDLLSTLRARGVPAVGVAGSRVVQDTDSFVPDDIGGGALASRYLLGLGHRRIAFLGSRDSRTTELRYAGFCQALAAAGLEHDPDLLVLADGYDERAASRAVDTLIARHLPFTALVAFNDIMALGALQALQRQGLGVPDWVSLIGFDDTVSAYACPQMTTISCSKETMGREAVRQLLRRMGGDGGALCQRRLPMGLTVRASTTRNTRT